MRTDKPVPPDYKVYKVELMRRVAFTVTAPSEDAVKTAIREYGHYDLVEDSDVKEETSVYLQAGTAPTQADNGVASDGRLLHIDDWLNELGDDEEGAPPPPDNETIPLTIEDDKEWETWRR